jgi:hypothetical protein
MQRREARVKIEGTEGPSVNGACSITSLASREPSKSPDPDGLAKDKQARGQKRNVQYFYYK